MDEDENSCEGFSQHETWNITRAEAEDSEYVRIYFECNRCDEQFDTIFHKEIFYKWLPKPEEGEN